MDRLGALYAGGGALAVALLTAYWPKEGWWLAPLIVLIVLSAYATLAAGADWWLPFRPRRLSDVLVEAFTLSEDIAAFAAIHRRNIDDEVPCFDSWDRDTERLLRRTTSLRSDYQARFAAQALTAFRRLQSLGAQSVGHVDEQTVSDPVNLLGVESVARALVVMAAEVQARR